MKELLLEQSNKLVAVLFVIIFCCFNVVVFAQSNRSEEIERKEAVKNYEERNYEKAIQMFEKILKNNPKDAEVSYAYGLYLLMKAIGIDEVENQRNLVKQAKEMLFKAKELGIEDKDLEEIVDAFNKKDGEKLGQLMLVLSLHPPKIFENDPPQGVKLIDGYKHKGNGDFEGNYGGKISKKGGLTITYGYSAFDESEVKNDELESLIETKELTNGDKKIKYGVTKENIFIAMVTNHNSIVYRAKIKTIEDIEIILAIIFPK